MGTRESALRKALWALLALVLLAVGVAAVRDLLPPEPATRAKVPAAPGLPAYGRVPDFALTERSGRRVEAAELAGRVWIVNFIYTYCTDTCPLQSAQMAELQAEFAGARDLGLVSITVDPVRDTPGVLATYAARYGADPSRWLFLTGSRGAILALARDGFRVGVTESPRGPEGPLDKAFPPAGAPPVGGGRAGVGASRLSRRWSDQAKHVGRRLAQAVWGGIGADPALAHEAPAPAGPILHSSRFVLVDRRTTIRGYYESGEPEAFQRLRRDVRSLLAEAAP